MTAALDMPRFSGPARCAETDPEAFFPEKGGTNRTAKRICAGCEVRDECLAYALEKDERFGVWGGLSERERRRLRTAPAASAQATAARSAGRPVEPIKHGPEYGYKRCSQRPGGACPACREANTDRWRQTMAKRAPTPPVPVEKPTPQSRLRPWHDDELADAVAQLRGYGKTFGEMAAQLNTSITRVRAAIKRRTAA